MNSTKIIFAVLYIVSLNLFGQENMKFDYQIIYKNNYEDVIEQYTLLNSTDNTAFINKNVFKTDSLRKNNENITYRDPLNLNLFYNKNLKEATVYWYTPQGNVCYKLKSKDSISWKLHNDTKIIMKHVLQKATTTFGGRNWIAWFASDIPFSEGPYKFRGLPGLIFEIYDDQMHYTFSLVDIKKNDLIITEFEHFIDSNQSGKPIFISLERYKKQILQEYDNTFGNFMMATEGTWRMTLEDGQTINTHSKLKEIINDTKNKVKNNYNPIELDKAVIYPNK